jgi:hypothetical protein
VHRMADCRKGEKYGKGLLVDSSKPVKDSTREYDQGANFDDIENEEIVIGDEGPLQVVRRVYLTPRKMGGDDWRRHNIFHSTCTMRGKVCKLIIDSRSCENVVSEEAV